MIHFIFCRTLNSQSAASVTMANYAALLRERHLSVRMTLIDKKKSFREQLEKLESGKYLLCKINADDYQMFFSELRKMKANGRWTKIILCGPFAALHYGKIMEQELWADGIILGYGEQAVIDQFLHLDRNGTIDTKVSGVWRLPNGCYAVNMPVASFPMKNLPLPARDIEAIDSCAIGNLEFSRGCDNRCYYCHMRAYNELFGISRTKKTVDQVMADLMHLYKMGKRYFIFNDSVFWNGSDDTEDVQEICKRIVASGMKLYFMVYLSLYRFPDEDLLRIMYNAGLIRIFVGVENQSANVLHKIKETEYPVRLFEKYRLVMEQMHISYHIGFIVFYPFSNVEQVRESIDYLHSIGKMHRVGILLERIRLIPGTPICRYLDKDKFNDSEIDTAYHYLIQDPLCEKLQTQLLDFFSNKLQDSYVQMELLCCNLNILESIMAHECGNISPIEEQVKTHRQLIEEYGNLIYTFIQKAIDDIQAGKNFQFDNGFVKKYAATGKALTKSWAVLQDALVRYTDTDARDVFPFWQEWMEKNGEKWDYLCTAACSL